MTIRNFKPGDEPEIIKIAQAADDVDRAEMGLTESDSRRRLGAAKRLRERCA